MTELAEYRATGRRKRSVARVILRPGDGKLKINKRGFDSYFRVAPVTNHDIGFSAGEYFQKSVILKEN